MRRHTSSCTCRWCASWRRSQIQWRLEWERTHPPTVTAGVDTPVDATSPPKTGEQK